MKAHHFQLIHLGQALLKAAETLYKKIIESACHFSLSFVGSLCKIIKPFHTLDTCYFYALFYEERLPIFGCKAHYGFLFEAWELSLALDLLKPGVTYKFIHIILDELFKKDQRASNKWAVCPVIFDPFDDFDLL